MNIDQRAYGYQPAQSQLDALRNIKIQHDKLLVKSAKLADALRWERWKQIAPLK